MLETSELFMLDDFSVETALYGDLVVEFPAVKSPCEKVGELTARRNTQGFFSAYVPSVGGRHPQKGC